MSLYILQFLSNGIRWYEFIPTCKSSSGLLDHYLGVFLSWTGLDEPYQADPVLILESCLNLTNCFLPTYLPTYLAK